MTEALASVLFGQPELRVTLSECLVVILMLFYIPRLLCLKYAFVSMLNIMSLVSPLALYTSDLDSEVTALARLVSYTLLL